MKAKTYRTILLHGVLALCLMSLGAVEARAQDVGGGGGSLGQTGSRAGTAGSAHLLIPVTARHTALGATSTSGLANMHGLEALYSNPAGLSSNAGTAALFSRMEYVADIGVNYFGIGQAIGNNNLAFTISTWDFGDIPEQTESSPEISEVTYNASFITAGLTYARQLTDRIAAGVTVKAVNESIDDVSATAVAFDAGMNYVVGETGLRLGVSLKNIGNEIQYDGVGLTRQVRLPGQDPSANQNAVQIEAGTSELPSLLNFGVAYSRDLGASSQVTVLGNFRSNSFDQDQYAGGLELSFQELVYVRGGYQVVQDTDDTFFQGASFGAGLNLNLGGSRLTIDYAYLPTDFFEDVQFITASVTL